MDNLFGPRQLTLAEAIPPDVTLSAAEACVLHLAGRFAREYQERGSPDRVPDDLDWVARACLYVCSGHPVPATPAVLGRLQEAQTCLQAFSLYRSLDALPFELSQALVEGGAESLPFPVLRLASGDSSVRLYLFEMGWLVRTRLRRDRCVPYLLRNVENTLGHWFCSLALCRHLFPEAAEFWAAVEAYEPEEMPDQYEERIAWARENEYDLEHPGHFLELERKCAGVVQEYLLGLRVCWPADGTG